MPSNEVAAAPASLARPLAPILLLAALATAGCGPGAPPAAAPADLDRYRRGETQFPDSAWAALPDPVTAGWSESGLAEARRFYDGLESAALQVVHRGVVVLAWGDPAARYTAQSLRKSLLSALIGLEVDAGRLRLDATLEELGIDEEPPLSPVERTATVRDLLLSRSGIYRPALYEHGSWKRAKPAPGSNRPGEAWFYNNWGFNALGTIYERAAAASIGDRFAQAIAAPLQMEDFRPADVAYLTRDSLTERISDNDSIHPAYVFRISTRDLARFGLLYLEQGRWGGRQVLPADWVRETFEGVPIGTPGVRYGYLWWIFTPESPEWSGFPGPVLVGQGARGHWLAVIPELDLVIAHQVATGGLGLPAQARRRTFGSPEVSDEDLVRLAALVARACPVSSGDAD